MLIEEILPINYYNQLIGILVDTAILKILIKKLMPKLSAIIENNKDFDGHFIGEILFIKISQNQDSTVHIFHQKFSLFS